MGIDAQTLLKITDLAQKANPGPWKNVISHPHLIVTDKSDLHLENWPIGEIESYNDAAYIAAASPDVILAIAAELSELQCLVDSLKCDNNTLKDQNQRIASNNLELRSRNATLEKEADWLAQHIDRDVYDSVCPPVRPSKEICGRRLCVKCWRQAASKCVERNK